MTNHKGLIIVYDGPDGTGKTTQLELTARHLRKQGYTVHTARAAGGTPIGEELRKALLSLHKRRTETDVYISLAMHNELGHDLQKRRAMGQICLVDRSPMSIVAYNIYGSQLQDKNFGYNAFEKMMSLWKPDLAIIIRTAQNVINKRISKRSKTIDYFESQGLEYHNRVQEGYKKAIKLLQHHPEWCHNIAIINGEPPKNIVQQAIQSKLKSRFGLS